MLNVARLHREQLEAVHQHMKKMSRRTGCESFKVLVFACVRAMTTLWSASLTRLSDCLFADAAGMPDSRGRLERS